MTGRVRSSEGRVLGESERRRGSREAGTEPACSCLFLFLTLLWVMSIASPAKVNYRNLEEVIY